MPGAPGLTFSDEHVGNAFSAQHAVHIFFSKTFPPMFANARNAHGWAYIVPESTGAETETGFHGAHRGSTRGPVLIFSWNPAK